MQVLDSTPRAALDLAFEDQQNPFYACRLKLANLMHVGVGGPFACLFAILPVQLHGVMADELSAQLSAFIAQVRWRFLEYETFPFQWNRVLHRAVNQDEIDDTFETFFDIMRSCCRREGIDDKMFKYFGAPHSAALLFLGIALGTSHRVPACLPSRLSTSDLKGSFSMAQVCLAIGQSISLSMRSIIRTRT